MKEGWPQQVDDGLKPYKEHRDEISKKVDCFFVGTREVSVQAQQKCDKAYPGMSRMKTIAQFPEATCGGQGYSETWRI